MCYTATVWNLIMLLFMLHLEMEWYIDLSPCHNSQESDTWIDTTITILIHRKLHYIKCINMNVTYKAVLGIKFWNLLIWMHCRLIKTRTDYGPAWTSFKRTHARTHAHTQHSYITTNNVNILFNGPLNHLSIQRAYIEISK